MSMDKNKNIVVIVGHPDPDPNRYCYALANAYVAGAHKSGADTRLVEIARVDFPILRSKAEFDSGSPNQAIKRAQEDIYWAGHLVFVYPLWLGTMPALLKAFLEQVFRPGFAATESKQGQPWSKHLSGRSARVVITMGMPAFVYRWFYLAHSLKNLERNILGFCGIGPVRALLIGMVETCGDAKRSDWLVKMQTLGQHGR